MQDYSNQNSTDPIIENFINSASNIKTNLQNSTAFKQISGGAIDLRNLIIKMFIAWIFGLIITYMFQTPVYNFYITPLKENNLILSFLSPADSLMFYIKIYCVSGLLFSLPLQILLFWQYLKDALMENERKLIQNYFWLGALLTVSATIYGWLVLIPSIFKFLVAFNPPQTQLLLTAVEYSNFIFGILIMLVITFQVPIIIFILVKSGLVTKKQITSKRKQIYVAVLIGTAIFGSTDVATWFLSALPVILLIEMSLWLSSFGSKSIS